MSQDENVGHLVIEVIDGVQRVVRIEWIVDDEPFCGGYLREQRTLLSEEESKNIILLTNEKSA